MAVSFAAVRQPFLKPAIANSGGNGGLGGIGGQGQGGGLFIANGMVSLTNSTVANNLADGGNGGDGGDPGLGTPNGVGGNGGNAGLSQGGGVYLALGTLDMTNVTIAYNTSQDTIGGLPGSGSSVHGIGHPGTSGGVFNSSGTVNSLNTLIGDNTASFAPDFSGNFQSDSHDLLADGTGSNLAPGLPAANGNLVGSSGSPINPQLGTLQNNGGPTQTVALLGGSPAIDNAASAGMPSTDQRGVTRSEADIGAYAYTPVDNVAVFRASTGVWYLDEVQGSYNPATTEQIGNFGASGDIAVSGDWLGTGQTYVGVFRPTTGTWYLSTTNTNYSPANTIQIGNFGAKGDVPVIGHWGSNPNIDYVGVFRPSTGQWFLDEVQGSYNPATTIQINNFGIAGDTAVVGNWGNSSIADGRSYVGVFRPSTGQWFLDEVEGNYNPATTLQINNFGARGDTAVVGDWLGSAQDGHAYVGVFRPSTGQWFLSTTNTSYTAANTLQINNFGTKGDVPEVGDWLGTGLTEVGVFRPSTGTWYLSKTDSNYTPANTIQIGNFGAAGDQPAVGNWAAALPQFASGAGPGTSSLLTQAQLNEEVQVALDELRSAGADAALLAELDSAQYVVGQLPENTIGMTYVSANRIVIDASADGWGWFVDANPARDTYFANDQALSGSPAAEHMDLLTTVLHEMSHLAGLPDLSLPANNSNVLNDVLVPGARHISNLDAFFAGDPLSSW
jgi:hypothetical protein